jgi:hypothetical protein
VGEDAAADAGDDAILDGLAQNKVAPFALSAPIYIAPHVHKWVNAPGGTVQFLARPLRDVVVALLTRRDINTPSLFKWRVKEPASDPAVDESGRPPADYVYEESWDTPPHQNLMRDAIAATTARPDFIDLKRQVADVHHTVHVLGVGLVAGVNSAVLSQKSQQTSSSASRRTTALRRTCLRKRLLLQARARRTTPRTRMLRMMRTFPVSRTTQLGRPLRRPCTRTSTTQPTTVRAASARTRSSRPLRLACVSLAAAG